jgi:peptidoglycan-N-acetylglucosamine deacetylase
MAYWHISGWIKRLYPDLVWNKRETGRKLYLTFDDGPTPVITDKILDILDLYNAKATFFCLGRNVEHYPDIYQHILEKKHSVGNHTYSHLKGWKTGHKEYFQDIELAGQFIQSNLFRPPYGQINHTQIKYLKKRYKIIMWEVMSHDYENRLSKERSLKAVFRYTREGSIIVFHDSLKAANKALYLLPKILEEFTVKGYTFEAIDE